MNIQQFIQPQNQSQQDIREEWISHLINCNRVGINRVLDKYGYSGNLQPETREDTIEAIEMLIEYNGTDGIRDLMMAQPEFEAIKQILFVQNRKVIPIPVNAISQVVQTPQPSIPQPVMQNATGGIETAGLFSIPVNDIVKGAIIFGILYMLTRNIKT